MDGLDEGLRRELLLARSLIRTWACIGRLPERPLVCRTHVPVARKAPGLTAPAFAQDASVYRTDARKDSLRRGDEPTFGCSCNRLWKLETTGVTGWRKPLRSHYLRPRFAAKWRYPTNVTTAQGQSAKKIAGLIF
jgi:hypothetical protein